MSAEPATPLRTRVRLSVIGTGLVVIVVALVVLAGWHWDVPHLRAGGPLRIAMFPMTAVGFIASGAALALLVAFPTSRAARVAGVVLATLTALLGMLTTAERVLDVDVGIDLLLFERAVRAAPWNPPGRMAVNSAVALSLLGTALLLLHAGGRRARQIGQLLAFASFFIAFLALLGYAYGVGTLYTVGQFSGGMAVITAISLLVLSLGVFFARTEAGLAALLTNERASGMFSRRLVPAAVIVPVGLGWLLLTILRRGWVDERTGLATFAATAFVLLLLLLVRSARAVERLDRERESLLEAARKARADAEAANRAKMQFLTSMSHELRTPLNAISGYVQLLELGVHGPINTAQRDALERTQRSQQHLLALINDVLNFAKLDAGRVEFRITTVAMRDVLKAIEAMVLPQLAAKSLAFTMRCDDLDLAVLADREKLQQILLNLLSNAIKFTPAGGRIALECSAQPELARVTVRDTGPGIASDALDTIFEPFVQVDRSLTNLKEGAGLGLAISRELARGMGGELSAESALGEGATFILTLVRAPNRADARPAPAPVPVTVG
jgi:signal transduction histidine kinase